MPSGVEEWSCARLGTVRVRGVLGGVYMEGVYPGVYSSPTLLILAHPGSSWLSPATRYPLPVTRYPFSSFSQLLSFSVSQN